MQALLSLLLVAFPALLVWAIHLLWRREIIHSQKWMWIVVAVIWAISGAAWVSYARQQHDVGLMVHGIIGLAALVSAVFATLAAAVVQWRS